MSYDAIGRRYARAIFEIGKEEGNVAALAEQLRSFAESYKGNTELQTVLEHPMVTDEARAAIVLEIAQRVGAGATAQRALKLITRQRRVRAIAEVSRHLDRLVDEDAKVVRGAAKKVAATVQADSKETAAVVKASAARTRSAAAKTTTTAQAGAKRTTARAKATTTGVGNQNPLSLLASP